MTIETIREWRNRQPFEPFEVHLSDGATPTVWHSENIALGKTQVIIAYAEADRFVICDLNQIDSIQVSQAA